MESWQDEVFLFFHSTMSLGIESLKCENLLSAEWSLLFSINDTFQYLSRSGCKNKTRQSNQVQKIFVWNWIYSMHCNNTISLSMSTVMKYILQLMNPKQLSSVTALTNHCEREHLRQLLGVHIFSAEIIGCRFISLISLSLLFLSSFFQEKVSSSIAQTYWPSVITSLLNK